MSETPLSLLERLCQGSDPDLWRQLVNLYSPLIRGWLKQSHVPDHDADDLTQDVLMVVWRGLREFHHNQRRGAFRSWLRKIVYHRVLAFQRSRRYRSREHGDCGSPEALEQLDDLSGTVDEVWEREHDACVLQRLLEVIRSHFDQKTWDAFERAVFGGETPEQIASDLGMAKGSVYAAKSRVLKRLRQEAKGLVD